MPGFFRRFALATLAILLACTPAFAWDANTHREITFLAIETLPPSPLKNLFIKNLSRLEYFSVQPDVIRAKYGDESEKIRHYIDLEYYGADPFDALVPDRNAMNRRFGASMLVRSGTLPWTIVDFSNAFEQEWSRGDCNDLLRLAGSSRTTSATRVSRCIPLCITTATRAIAEFIGESKGPSMTTYVNFPSPQRP